MARREPLIAALAAVLAIAAAAGAIVVVGAALGACAEEREPPGAAAQGIHPADFVATHGRTVAELGWDLRVCAGCHGDDFAGGAAGVSCRTCHVEPEGPAACDTCHPARPTSGAHPAHLARWSCETCHVVPARWDAPGHVLDDPPPAEANGFDPTFGRCDVWCHQRARPRWTGGPAQAACGTCHDVPPPDHTSFECAQCHPGGAAHVNGMVDVHPPT